MSTLNTPHSFGTTLASETLEDQRKLIDRAWAGHKLLRPWKEDSTEVSIKFY